MPDLYNKAELVLILLSGSSSHSSFGLIFGLVVILLLLFCTAATSASETAFFSFSPTQLNDLRTSKSPADQRIKSLMADPRKLLATILITNNFMNIGVVIISNFLINNYFDFSNNPFLGFIIQVVVITSLLLLIGEIMPKVFANQNPIKVARIVSFPWIVMRKVLSPLSSILVRGTKFIDKRIDKKTIDITLDDISNAIDITADGKTDEEDRKIMKSITRFSNINVREIMTPRVDVTSVEKSDKYTQIMKVILDSGYSRIPVYDETPDRIIGILYIKDILAYISENDSFKWTTLIRPPFFVPENKPINNLLHEFQEKKIHLAVVVDEYGGTSGIITMEDIIEEIVGEINDEFDAEIDNKFFQQIDEYTWIFEGKTNINDMCRVMGIDDRLFDEAKGESETLAGLILELSGKLPITGESVEFDSYLFNIEQADKRRIKKVKVSITSK